MTIWIGIDITYQSIAIILKRLNEQSSTALAKSLANKQDDDRTRKEFEKWLVLIYSCNQAIINDKKKWRWRH